MPGKRHQRPVRRVLGISASPRKAGNTDLLLDAALEGARSAGRTIVEKIALRDLDYEGCRECGGCDKTGECVIRDDMRVVYRLIDRSDAVIVASPIFFGSITAQLKAMIDRFQPYWVARHVLRKGRGRARAARGFFISASAAGGKRYFAPARRLVRIFFATIGASYSGSVFAAGVEKKGSVMKEGGALRRSYSLGRESAR